MTSFGFDLTRHVLGDISCNDSVRNLIGVILQRAASWNDFVRNHNGVILHQAASKIWNQDLLEPVLKIQ
jgi:hypothetical protein